MGSRHLDFRVGGHAATPGAAQGQRRAAPGPPRGSRSAARPVPGRAIPTRRRSTDVEQVAI